MTTAASLARAQEQMRLGRGGRVVQHLRLRPACDDDAAQMRWALEDALHTADFGDCGRLVLVRRLRLQAVPPRASPAWMARALEQAWRTAAARAISAEAPGAGDALAVYFTSRTQARLAWLRRAASGADIGAWFWPAALPELKAGPAAAGATERLVTVVEALSLEGWADAESALQAWPDDQLMALARRLPSDTLHRLQHLSIAPSASFAARVADNMPQLDDVLRVDTPTARVARRLAHADLAEPAAIWLAALWLSAESGSRPTAAQARVVVVLAGQWSVAAVGQLSRPDGIDTSFAAEASLDRAQREVRTIDSPLASTATGAAGEAGPSPSTPPSADAASAPVWRLDSGLEAPRRADPAARPGVRRARASFAGSPWPWLDDSCATRHGGLLVLVNLLQALHFERWLTSQLPAARQPFVDALFTLVLSQCGAPPHDPQFGWFAPTPVDAEVLASARFSDAGRVLGTAAALRLWWLRARRVLRRHAGLDLPELVRREAWVSGSTTHLDVVFALADVDLRLRRHGLDSDPGWVAWFGRIVAFHFVEVDQLPAHGVGAEQGDG